MADPSEGVRRFFVNAAQRISRRPVAKAAYAATLVVGPFSFSVATKGTGSSSLIPKIGMPTATRSDSWTSAVLARPEEQRRTRLSREERRDKKRRRKVTRAAKRRNR